MREQPQAIEVRGARVHNLAGIDVTVPLRQLVGIAGVSGSGKSSLAMGVLYAEGSRRYLEALSTFTRRRLAQVPRAAVDSVEHVPAALALRQRPPVPGVRSTFGTSTELLNVLRLMFSRLSSHVCPNGHRQAPTLAVAEEQEITCSECGVGFFGPGAEALAFNSGGACPECAGTGVVRQVDDAALVPDPARTIDDGAVAPWSMFGLSVMPHVAAAMGVRTDVPYAELTDTERDVVLHGPAEKRHIAVPTKNGKLFEMDFTYRNARAAVQEAMDKATTEKGLTRVGRFIRSGECGECGGTRLSAAARAPMIGELNLADATALTLDQITAWSPGIVESLPPEMRDMAQILVDTLSGTARRLLELGLGYIGLDRAGASLSTGERQRVQLARAVRNRTTGVLYVLDEPSVGLHPANVDGLLGVFGDLVADGNSVVVVDHDVAVLRAMDTLLEIGPGSGADGGTVVASGTADDLSASPRSLLAAFLDGREPAVVRERAADVFACGRIHLETRPIHTVEASALDLPAGRLTAVTGVSGSGKSTLILEGLVPALSAVGGPLPAQVAALDAPGITRVAEVDATPIGVNVRSTVATYSGVLDDLRREFARTDDARRLGLKAADFSYNTGSLRCPRCEGTGQVSLDVQFLPDVDIDCPDCAGRRYSADADGVLRGEHSLPDVLALSVRRALDAVGDVPRVRKKLQTLIDLGLGYLTLGEGTPALSGGEAQRLQLATELHRDQSDAVFVLDEPSVGLHPSDVRVLLDVLTRLTDRGATVVVIEHDLDMIANADHVIDMGPGGGAAGGRIVATGTPDEVAADPASVTGRYLAAHLARAGGITDPRPPAPRTARRRASP
ncbi:excinuclease ABC subunit UvrA [Tsukamurella sp. 8F]|uniref:excinuclease ABC subunit UvrA n=1 Tax=unclassified Tsukamurella TaxID=2633480 RepID=UPI0023BA31AB|nr:MULTISPECIES: excinuclease ABC subunit UvrA [unclassified Tsukamurella]MDF0532252.1 excinuclease ABC subunit UvrA [Tsukamurella sp. 8J]MDF0589494.1 excinuclease ABC subunit UvrA [Tsukamurella sp. 8F]